MSLASGARIGPYEIVSLVGVGGRGEVFRDRDTKLKSEVALKVLPEGSPTTAIASRGLPAKPRRSPPSITRTSRTFREPGRLRWRIPRNPPGVLVLSLKMAVVPESYRDVSVLRQRDIALTEVLPGMRCQGECSFAEDHRIEALGPDSRRDCPDR
jgi:hypothetical protein